MQMRKVVVTGMGAVSPLGTTVNTMMDALERNESGIRSVDDLRNIPGLHPAVAGLVPEIDVKSIPRKYRRTMSPMSIFATIAAEEAITQAGLSEENLAEMTTGLCVGSTIGSAQTFESVFSKLFEEKNIGSIKSTEFFKIMNHSAASNLAQRFGIQGRVMAPSSACSTGCQTIGLAAEVIAMGKQDVMICGGTDEFHPLTVGTFDIIQAASIGYNDNPDQTPRPFDSERDGIVCAEGAGILILESEESALKRGAPILAEIAGFGSTSDPANPASPSPEAIERCMMTALDDAEIEANDVDYVNAHATATLLGDVAEAAAIASLFGKKPLVSGLKGHLGHTMAASGALETIATISMMQSGLVIPTRNLIEVAPNCTNVNHAVTLKNSTLQVAVKNNFALGGINTSLVLRSA